MDFRLKDNNDKETGGVSYQDIRMIKCANNPEPNQDLLYCKRKTTSGEEVVWRRDRIVYFNVPSYASITVLSGDSNTNNYHRYINTKNNQTVVDATDEIIATTKGYYFYQYESNTLNIQISCSGQYYIPSDGITYSVDKFNSSLSNNVELIDNTYIYKNITITLKPNEKILEDITITVTPQPYYYINIKSNNSYICGELTYFNESVSLETFNYISPTSYKKYFVKPLKVSNLYFYSFTKGTNATMNSKITDRDLAHPDEGYSDKHAITGWSLTQNGSAATPSVTPTSYINFNDDSSDTYYVYLLVGKYYNVIWNQGKIDKNTEFEVSTIKVYSTEVINSTNQRDNTSVDSFSFNFEEKTNSTVVNSCYNSNHARYKVYTNENRSGKTLLFWPVNWDSVKNQYDAEVYSIESTKTYEYPKIVDSNFEDVYDTHASRKRYSFEAKVYNYNSYPDAYFYSTPSEIYHGDKFQIASNEDNDDTIFNILKFWDNNQARSTFGLRKGSKTGYTRKAVFNLSNNEELTSNTTLYATINQTINSYPVYFNYTSNIQEGFTNASDTFSNQFPSGHEYQYQTSVYCYMIPNQFYYITTQYGRNWREDILGKSKGKIYYCSTPITVSTSGNDFGTIEATPYDYRYGQIAIEFSRNDIEIFNSLDFINSTGYAIRNPVLFVKLRGYNEDEQLTDYEENLSNKMYTESYGGNNFNYSSWDAGKKLSETTQFYTSPGGGYTPTSALKNTNITSMVNEVIQGRIDAWSSIEEIELFFCYQIDLGGVGYSLIRNFGWYESYTLMSKTCDSGYGMASEKAEMVHWWVEK